MAAVILLVVCALSLWTTCVCATNVALKKPATQSSEYILEGKNKVYYYSTPDRVVDGNRSNGADLDKNSCSHTKDTDEPKEAWWRVDLKSSYYITLVKITYRNWGNAANVNSAAARLAGFYIYVSDTDNFKAGQVCFHDTNSSLTSTEYTKYFLCNQPLSGRYLTIYNFRNQNSQSIYSPDAILELCEVEIDDPAPCLHCVKSPYPYCDPWQSNKCLNGCDPGYYGDQCNNRCTCDGDGRCNQLNGKCNTCNAGTYKYSTICTPCPVNCGGIGNLCNIENGVCSHGCDDRFFGPVCSASCPNNCIRCISALNCSICQDGYYGTTCSQPCNNCKNKKCNITGHCTEGCNKSFYGGKCSLKCSAGCLNDECIRNSGVCVRGCDTGYYGMFCNQTCPENCGGNTRGCDRDTGYCFSCIGRHFGLNCSLNCSDHCGGEGNCDIKTGHCSTEPCDAGWEGLTCETAIMRSSHQNSNEEEGGPPVGTIAGAAAAAVVVIILALLAIIIIRKRKSKDGMKKRYEAASSPSETNPDNVYLNVGYRGSTPSEKSPSKDRKEVTEKDARPSSSTKTAPRKSAQLSEKPEIKPKPRTSNNGPYYNAESNEYYNTDSVIKGIPLGDFKEYVAKMIAEGKLMTEYEGIPYGALYPTTIGEREENKLKNRFKTTFPYDRTIVTLRKSGNQKSEYINANFVHGLFTEKKYIATQGPLPNTVDDFWRMVWQYDVSKVVMLTGLVEGGKTKCHKYWPEPNEPLEHGGYTLTTLDERKYSYYTLREIKMEDKKAKQSRRLLHYHFTAWPDHDVTNPVLLVQFHRRVVSNTKYGKGPLLVHCSAGIGRTGTYIGLDELLEQGKKQGRIDVKDYVRKMRDCRMNMVQKPAQYQLLHEALVEALQLPESAIAMSEFPAEWERMENDNRPINQQRLKKEYETLKGMKRIRSTDDYKSANSKENKHKNRPKSSLALDEYRPYLMKYIRGRTDYINAVIIPSYTSDIGYYVTHRPLKDTVVDFWRLVTDHGTKTIVHFESEDEEKTTFYPESDQLDIDEFTISTLKVQNISDALKEYETVIFSKEEEEEITLNLVKVSTKKAHLPDSMTLIKAAELANNKKIGPNQSAITVVSCDGTSSCDVFCAVMNVMESMKLDNEIDMFQTVRQLQMRRPEFFADFENYRIAYEAIYKHLTSENVYFN